MNNRKAWLGPGSLGVHRGEAGCPGFFLGMVIGLLSRVASKLLRQPVPAA